MVDRKADIEEITLLCKNLNDESNKRELDNFKSKEIIQNLKEEIYSQFPKLEQTEDIYAKKYKQKNNIKNIPKAEVVINMRTDTYNSINKTEDNVEVEENSFRSFGKQSNKSKDINPFSSSKGEKCNLNEDTMMLYKNYLKKRPIKIEPEKDSELLKRTRSISKRKQKSPMAKTNKSMIKNRRTTVYSLLIIA